MKKNLLLLTVDALGADKCWGLNKNLTSFINALGQKGVVFTNAFSTTSSTTPSIASIHTGHYPNEHGILSTYGYSLKSGVETLAEILKANGFRNYADIGGALKPETKLNRGFDKYIYRSPFFKISFLKWRYYIKRMALNEKLMFRNTDTILKSKPPWFYWIHLLDLHNRWRPKKNKLKNIGLTDYEIALISLDKKIKKILEKINIEDTIVVISADHGHHVSEIDKFRKNINYAEAHGFHIYDYLIRIPLIILGCRIPVGITIDKQISTIDILPTIIDILKIKNRRINRGHSLLNYINFETGKCKKNVDEWPIYSEACGSILRRSGKTFLKGIRVPGWKLAMSKNKESDSEPELYDLEKDPNELHNVYNKYPEKAKSLIDILNRISS